MCFLPISIHPNYIKKIRELKTVLDSLYDVSLYSVDIMYSCSHSTFYHRVSILEMAIHVAMVGVLGESSVYILG